MIRQIYKFLLKTAIVIAVSAVCGIAGSIIPWIPGPTNNDIEATVVSAILAMFGLIFGAIIAIVFIRRFFD